VIAGSAFAIVSVTGLGAVADSAVPGDSLYPVDRAYEAVGRAIGRNADRTQETLQEAITLAQRGDRDRAVVHVATELGRIIGDGEADFDTSIQVSDEAALAVEVGSDAEPTKPVVTSEAATAAAAAESVEAPVEPTASIAELTEDGGDPFLLALENALRATQAAAGTGDEVAVAEADAAVKSVVKLASGVAEEVSGTETTQVAPGPLAVPTTTRTTTTTVVRGNGNGVGNSTTTTTTTSVPTDSEQPPGDGQTAGDDSSGSPKGSTGAGEPGDAGDAPPGPIILPIP
jgi:hypothetical protein